jgi:hypothetical protein
VKLHVFVLILLLAFPLGAAARPLDYPPPLRFLTSQAGFPIDQGASPGGARSAWREALSGESRAFLLANSQRLEHDARRGRINAASWAMLRAALLEIEATPSMSARRLVTRFEREQEMVDRMFAALPAPTTLGEELFRRNTRRAFISDTVFRRPEANTDPVLRRLSEIDGANMARLIEALGDRDWVDDAIDGLGAQAEAWAIVEHDDWEPQVQLSMLERILPVAESGRVPSAFAMEWDRWAVSLQRQQRYGLMLRCWRGDYVATGGIEDAEHVDERRAAMGLRPWADDREEARSRYVCPPNAPLGSQGVR